MYLFIGAPGIAFSEHRGSDLSIDHITLRLGLHHLIFMAAQAILGRTNTRLASLAALHMPSLHEADLLGSPRKPQASR